MAAGWRSRKTKRASGQHSRSWSTMKTLFGVLSTMIRLPLRSSSRCSSRSHSRKRSPCAPSPSSCIGAPRPAAPHAHARRARRWSSCGAWISGWLLSSTRSSVEPERMRAEDEDGRRRPAGRRAATATRRARGGRSGDAPAHRDDAAPRGARASVAVDASPAGSRALTVAATRGRRCTVREPTHGRRPAARLVRRRSGLVAWWHARRRAAQPADLAPLPHRAARRARRRPVGALGGHARGQPRPLPGARRRRDRRARRARSPWSSSSSSGSCAARR